MARPEKQGLDYFPLDIDIDSDDKVYLIQAKHGIAGFGILIKLFMKIYRNGYYLRFTEREEIIFAAQNNIDINVCRNVVNECINESIFDKDIYNKYQILTSRGIQKRYFEVSERRKKTELIKEICLIDTSKYNNLVNVDINYVNNNINPKKTGNRGEDVNIYPETESKQKVNKTESKQNTTTFAASDEKTHRLPPKENESSNVQPDVTSGLSVTTTQGMLLELPGKTIPDRITKPSGETTQGEFSEPPVKTVQDVITELPAKITQDVPTGLLAKITPDTLPELSGKAKPDGFIEPSVKATPGKLSELPDKTRDVLAEYSLGQKNGETDGVVKPLPQNSKISFDYETGKFTNVTDIHVEKWRDAYPAVDVLIELRQMEIWADANRKNRKSDWQRFIINWLKRSQDKARPTAPSWKGGVFGRFRNNKPTHVGKTEEPSKYAGQVDEVIYTDA